MRVTLDASSLLTPQTGIGRYTEQLVRALLASEAAELTLWTSPRPGAGRARAALVDTFGPLGAHFRHNPVPNRILHAAWEIINTPSADMLGRGEIFHAANHLAPPRGQTPVVATIHDLTSLRFPEWHAPYQRLVARYLPKSVARCDRLIADSEATARDLRELLGVPSERIRVVPLAAAPGFYRPIAPEEALSVRARYGLTQRYFLFVGTMEPRKNLGTLLLAYQKLPASVRESCELVLVGSRGWEDERLFTTIEALPSVRYLGRVDDAALPALMAGCVGFVYPSRYEGFGLPVLEAMAAGAPVVTSTASSLPEVAGEAALLVDPDDVEGLASAMRALAEDPALAERLRARGHERARAFSWAQTAAATLEVYRELVEARR